MTTTDNTLNAYGTSAEIAFIDDLARKPQATMLLSNYVAAAHKRVSWGAINREHVIEYAGLMLGNAQAAAHTATRVGRAA